LARLKAATSVTVGGIPATVLYAGAAPGLVAGVVQLNVGLPINLSPGRYALIWTAGEKRSPDFLVRIR
jgi:uncharacterized protein (TIGR03437 family)